MQQQVGEETSIAATKLAIDNPKWITVASMASTFVALIMIAGKMILY